MIDLSNKYLLQIEPDKQGSPSSTSIEDELTKKVDYILSRCHEGTMYRGFHTTLCGKHSDSCDFVLPNGMVTNSLCTYYIRYYRPYIPQSEIEKIEKAYKDLKNNSDMEHLEDDYRFLIKKHNLNNKR